MRRASKIILSEEVKKKSQTFKVNELTRASQLSLLHANISGIFVVQPKIFFRW